MKHKYDYTKDRAKMKDNTSDYSPNVGENVMHYEGNSEGGRDSSVQDMAGVEYGLGSIASIEVKNAEMVTQNQRPEGRTDMYGEFEIGIS